MVAPVSVKAQSTFPADEISVWYVANTSSSTFTDGWTTELSGVVAKLFSGWSSIYGSCSSVSTSGAAAFVHKTWNINGQWASRYWSSTVGLVKSAGCGDPDGPDYPARTWDFPITKKEDYKCSSGSIKVPVVTDRPLCVSSAPPPPPPCPVAPLRPITDQLANEHENGRYVRNPDMDNVTAQVKVGAACIVQKAAGLQATARITSGFRPPAYQAHLREVWDKWKQLANNSSESCRVIKAEVQAHWVKHLLVRQPVNSSNHSLGNAVDIAGVPQADTIAASCNMFRPEPVGDPVHFQPR